jgi:hypothetical protein
VERDILLDSHGIRVAVDQKVLPLHMGGSVLDCSEGLQKKVNSE